MSEFPTIPGLRILSAAGSGGLGDVFLAERISTGGRVAVKVLRSQDVPSRMTERIQREVGVLLRLKGHPGVISVEDVLSTAAGPALVMEYADRGSLWDLLQRTGPFSPAQVKAVAIQVAAVLKDAHALDIVHRDIKPHNILVTQFGTYKVCDFGIASVLRGNNTAQTDWTSPRYSSPEELDGESATAASDIFALGVTLNELRSGKSAGARSRVSDAFDASNETDRLLASLVAEMLRAEAVSRPSAVDVLKMLGCSDLVIAQHDGGDTSGEVDLLEAPTELKGRGPDNGLPDISNESSWWD